MPKTRPKKNGKLASLPFLEISRTFLVEQRMVKFLASALWFDGVGSDVIEILQREIRLNSLSAFDW